MSDQPPERQDSRTHGADGKFTRDPATAERDAQAARLRSRGWSYRRIAAELDLSVSNAHAAVQRTLRAIVEEPAQDVRQLELERLDAMYDAVLKVLETRHITVSQGRVVRQRILDENGDPIVVGQEAGGKPVFREEDVLDDGPVLAAVDRLLKIQERRARLLGLDAPTKAEIGGKLSYEIVGVDLGQL